MAVCEICRTEYDPEKQSWNCPHNDFPAKLPEKQVCEKKLMGSQEPDKMENQNWRHATVEQAKEILCEDFSKRPYHHFEPVGNPAVIKFLDKVLPGVRVRDFSLHFNCDAVSTLKAEIVLEEGDVEEFLGTLAETVTVEKSNVEIAEEVVSSIPSNATCVQKGDWELIEREIQKGNFPRFAEKESEQG